MFMLDPLYTARLDPSLEGFLVRGKSQTTPTYLGLRMRAQLVAMPQILLLFILAQVWLSTSHFIFELEVDLDSVTAGDFSCDSGRYDDAQCCIYFEVFCLREGREDSLSFDDGNCPLGRNTERMNAYLENQSNTRRITSDSPWPVRKDVCVFCYAQDIKLIGTSIQITFQLYFETKDSEPGPSSDDDIDDIFINKALEVNTSYTEMEMFTGNLERVSFQARFRVMCQQNYYGARCDTHCEAQDDDENGHYTCNSAGSFQCLEGFENPNNNCLDSKFIMQIIIIKIKLAIGYIQATISCRHHLWLLTSAPK